MSSATSAEVHVAADVSVTDSARTGSIINNADRPSSNIPISPSQKARMDGDAIFSDNNHSSSSAEKSCKNGGNKDNAAGNTDAGNRSSASPFVFATATAPTPQTTRSETMLALVHNMPDLDTPSIHADEQTKTAVARGGTATEVKGAAAATKKLDADATSNSMMDLDYEVHSASPFANLDDGASGVQKSPSCQPPGASQQLDLSETSHIPNYSFSHSATISSNCSSDPPTNTHSPLSSFPYSARMSVLAAPASNKQSIARSFDLVARGADVSSSRAGSVAAITSFAAAASPDSCCHSPLVSFNTSGLAEDGNATQSLSFASTSYLSTTAQAAQPLTTDTAEEVTSNLTPTTSLAATVAASNTSINTSMSMAMAMDSDSEPDNELSPVQRAQQVSESFSLSEQPSPQSIQRSEARVAPIRSLTEALALSPKDYLHPLSRDPSTFAVLQRILDRVEEVYQCCTNIAHAQEQSSRQIQSLERAVERIGSVSNAAAAAALGPVAVTAAVSTAMVTSSAAAEAALFPDPADPPIAITEPDTLLTLPSSLRHRQATLVSDESNVIGGESSEHLMRQGRDPYVTPQSLHHDERLQQRQQQQDLMPGSAGYQSPSRFATSVYRHHHHANVRGAPYSSSGAFPSASTLALAPASASVANIAQSMGALAHSPSRSYHYHQYQYQQQQQQQQQQHKWQHRGSISATSPSGHRLHHSDSGSHAQRGSSQPQQQYQQDISWAVHHQQLMQPAAHEGSLHGAGEGGSSSQVTLPSYSSVPPMTSVKAEGETEAESVREKRVHPQQQQQQQQIYQQQHSQPPPHPASAPVPGTPISVFGYGFSSATSSSTGMHMSYSTEQQQQQRHQQMSAGVAAAAGGSGSGIAGYPGTRAKRPRVAEGASDEYDIVRDESAASASGSAFRSSVQLPQLSQLPQLHYRQTHYHQHQHRQHSQSQSQAHAVLPPIRSGSEVDISPGAGTGTGSGTSSDLHMRNVRNPGNSDPSTMQLVRPEVSAASSSRAVGSSRGTGTGTSGAGHTRTRDSSGKGAAASKAGQKQGASAGEVVRGNPEAQPTAAWLSSQRHYKVALLHLLTLESFYPSDVAMLNMFRSQGDFTNEQIEASGAPLLSWARSWLRYNRNAVLRGTLETKSKSTLHQLAEALQHDLHAEMDFTTPQNLRKCALLRLIFYEWQAVNKLGTKSQSLYRDYESRLREIEALGTQEEQEAEWQKVVQEEHSRRLALIRESRGSGSSAILPKPEASTQSRSQSRPHSQSQSRSQQSQPQIQSQQHQLAGPSLSAGSSSLSPTRAGVSSGHSAALSLTRQQSMDWPAYPAAESPTSGLPQHTQQQQQQQHFQQRHFVQQRFSMRPQSQLQTQSQHQHQQQIEYQYHMSSGGGRGSRSTDLPAGSTAKSHTGSGRQTAIGKDDDSELSVKMSPEPQ
ncbi:hypothetical protein LPJ64_003066 [Coemansia asiatica]|uniref:Uncharacterized protein n=1 Tax=Coemansia asiatica TaxID=1052880 RepID=A0A9W8CKC7_9FUNG|nr:hypothetical protein LPJ64_003066 [Coemansia asiatica]